MEVLDAKPCFAALHSHTCRATHIFVRVLAWMVTPVLSATLLSMLMLALVPTIRQRCTSAADAQIGNLPINLSLSLAACVLAFLHMPAAASLDNPVLQVLQADLGETEVGVGWGGKVEWAQ